ncbi:MAG: hypothetical protein HC804_07205, partial [Anaerolineae bacterium]|nr:hypothetical protein [Anaerolineae bacterium]
LITFLRLRQFPYALLLTWLLVGLLPSALTPQSPSTIRMIGALPAVFVIGGVAVSVIANWLSANWLSVKREQFIVTSRTHHFLLFTFYFLLLTIFILNTGRTITAVSSSGRRR